MRASDRYIVTSIQSGIVGDCFARAAQSGRTGHAASHQPAGRVIDKHQQGALRPAVLEPPILAAVDLHQFADALAPRPRLMNPPLPLLAIKPQPVDDHPLPQGLAADIHAPHEGEAESEQANWHAHLLITTRRLDGDHFSAKKARDLDPEVRHAGGRAIVAEGEAWDELWRDHQNRYFREHGIDLAVDPTAVHPAPHIGLVRRSSSAPNRSAKPTKPRRTTPIRC
jgi:hypothetical protein